MKYIDNLEELCKMIAEVEEPIIYPVKEEGMIFLDFFRYSNEKFRWGLGNTRFLCITRENLPFGFAQQTIQNLPVIPLKYLIHFKNTATFFVASPNDLITEDLRLLENFGCKNIVAVSDIVIFQMKKKLEEFKQSGRVMDWHLNYFMKKISEFEYRIAEQNELCATNTKAFAEYRNAFRGKKVVIVGGGPTVEHYIPIKDAIHIGVNFAWRKENISFDYLFTNDSAGNLSCDPKMEVGFERIKDKIFICKRLERMEGFAAFNYSEEISMKYNNIARFYTEITMTGEHVYQDICFHPLVDFYSTVFSAIHFALFTYPKELYFVGLDTTATGHFYDENNPSNLTMTNIKIGYARMKMFAENHYPDVDIISINPVGLKGLFKDVYTDEYNQINH
ncbi:MAG: hypothetical protein IK062_10815 [Selenomonadaceae bacterium]|nr:hypothetical protein [Selenomonadaceae bacterium]